MVMRTFNATTLKPGDKLLSVNQGDVSLMSVEEIVAVLRGIDPTAVIPLVVRREGKALNLELTCSNARPAMEAMLGGLDQAGAGKFDECATAFGQRDDFGTYGAIIEAQCASLSKNSKRYNIAQLTHDAMRMLVEDAHWAPGSRTEVIDRLRATEGLITQGLGAARYQELVRLTQKWPGGQRAYDASAPDWRAFRRNAEAALKGRLVDPDSARIEWPYGFTYGTWKPLLGKRFEGYWSCGLINARNRMGGYTGSTFFVVVLDSAGQVQFADVGSARDFDILANQCSKSVKLLPPAPPEFAGSPSVGTPGPAVSIADELKKLVDLRNSGALTEAEFQAAKQKLLGGANQP